MLPRIIHDHPHNGCGLFPSSCREFARPPDEGRMTAASWNAYNQTKACAGLAALSRTTLRRLPGAICRLQSLPPFDTCRYARGV